jgi:hypothetical protein
MRYQHLRRKFYHSKAKFCYFCSLMVKYIIHLARFTAGKFWRTIRQSNGALKTMNSSSDTKRENDIKDTVGSDGQIESENTSSDSDVSQHDTASETGLSKRYITRAGIAASVESESAQVITNDSDSSAVKNSVTSDIYQQSLAATSTKVCTLQGHADTKRILGKESVGTREIQHQQAAFFSLWNKDHKTREQVVKEEKGKSDFW